METLIGLTLLVAVAALAYIAVRYSRQRSAQEAARKERSDTIARVRPVDPLAPETALSDPSRLAPGDVVAFEGEQWVVRGTLTLTEGSDRWHEHLMDTGNLRRYLSVEPGEGELYMVLWRRVLAPELSPGAARVEYDGRTWTRAENGRASFTAIGTTGTAPSGFIEYFDYAAGDDPDAPERLSFERTSGAGWDVSIGRRVTNADLDVFHRS